MTVAALPQWLAGSRRHTRIWLIAGAVSAALLGLLYLGMSSTRETGVSTISAQAYEVVPIDLDIKVTKDGEIQAINNIDVNCQVEGVSTITTIVKEGTSVKKGDVLLTLDATQIRQRIEDTSLELQKAEADVSNATEMLEIQKNSNATNLEGAEVAKLIAELDLKQYEEGSYPQQLANALTKVEMDKITLNNRLEDLDQTKRLYVKGFVTAADRNKAELDVTTARNGLEKSETELTVLTKYAHEMDMTAKRSAVVQTQQRLNRTKRENASNMSWRTSDLTAKQQSYTVLKRRYDRLQEQFAACNVIAPADGMVVYGSTTDRNSQNPIQEGAQVRERQLLIRLPDTSAMKAVVRIHESMVSRLKEGQRANIRIVGAAQPVTATISKISVLADSSNRWWNPDLREYPVDLALDSTPANLKPGIGATVEIMVDRLAQVVAVPLDAVYTVGGERYVFLRDGEDVRPAKVQVGANNDTHVQITDGLSVGQVVLRLQAGQGRELLEKAGIQVGPATRQGNGKPRPASAAH
jgi:HlyD family secretion protein